MSVDDVKPGPPGESGASAAGVEGSRLDWRFLIPNLERAVALNLDPDPSMPRALAGCCARVVTLDRSVEDDLPDLSAVRTEAGVLPPAGDGFDLVVFGRLIESMAGRAGERDGLVRQVAGMLRPAGRVVLLGRNPSMLARLRRRGSPDTAAQSGAGLGLRGYRRLLRNAGLELRAAYWVEPTCESPRHWIRLEHRGPAMHYLSRPQYREGPRARLLRTFLRGMAALGGASRFASNFLIVGGPVR